MEDMDKFMKDVSNTFRKLAFNENPQISFWIDEEKIKGSFEYKGDFLLHAKQGSIAKYVKRSPDNYRLCLFRPNLDKLLYLDSKNLRCGNDVVEIHWLEVTQDYKSIKEEIERELKSKNKD